MKKKGFLITGIISFIITWLFVGIYRDPEFQHSHFFFKYTPSFKVSFFSPIGMDDKKITDLSPEKQQEEKIFQRFINGKYEFIEKTGYLPILLIQLTLTFLSFGLFKQHFKYPNYWLQIPSHFLICLVFLFVLTFFMLAIDHWALLVLLGIILAGINFWIYILVSMLRKESHS
ncbi:hypothetical protein D3C87_181560 [compost metagenome]